MFGVPGEEGREVGREGELNYGVFLFFRGVVVWSASDAVKGQLACLGGRIGGSKLTLGHPLRRRSHWVFEVLSDLKLRSGLRRRRRRL